MPNTIDIFQDQPNDIERSTLNFFGAPLSAFFNIDNVGDQDFPTDPNGMNRFWHSCMDRMSMVMDEIASELVTQTLGQVPAPAFFGSGPESMVTTQDLIRKKITEFKARIKNITWSESDRTLSATEFYRKFLANTLDPHAVGKDNFRDMFEHLGPVAQCAAAEKFIARMTTYDWNTCYICGHPIHDVYNPLPGNRVIHATRECEHILPAFTALGFKALIQKTQNARNNDSPFYEYEYANSHKYCNQTKGDDLWIACVNGIFAVNDQVLLNTFADLVRKTNHDAMEVKALWNPKRQVFTANRIQHIKLAYLNPLINLINGERQKMRNMHDIMIRIRQLDALRLNIYDIARGYLTGADIDLTPQRAEEVPKIDKVSAFRKLMRVLPRNEEILKESLTVVIGKLEELGGGRDPRVLFHSVMNGTRASSNNVVRIAFALDGMGVIAGGQEPKTFRMHQKEFKATIMEQKINETFTNESILITSTEQTDIIQLCKQQIDENNQKLIYALLLENMDSIPEDPEDPEYISALRGHVQQQITLLTDDITTRDMTTGGGYKNNKKTTRQTVIYQKGGIPAFFKAENELLVQEMTNFVKNNTIIDEMASRNKTEYTGSLHELNKTIDIQKKTFDIQTQLEELYYYQNIDRVLRPHLTIEDIYMSEFLHMFNVETQYEDRNEYNSRTNSLEIQLPLLSHFYKLCKDGNKQDYMLQFYRQHLTPANLDVFVGLLMAHPTIIEDIQTNYPAITAKLKEDRVFNEFFTEAQKRMQPQQMMQQQYHQPQGILVGGPGHGLPGGGGSKRKVKSNKRSNMNRKTRKNRFSLLGKRTPSARMPKTRTKTQSAKPKQRKNRTLRKKQN